jgi:hypothetical protein
LQTGKTFATDYQDKPDSDVLVQSINWSGTIPMAITLLRRIYSDAFAMTILIKRYFMDIPLQQIPQVVLRLASLELLQPMKCKLNIVLCESSDI